MSHRLLCSAVLLMACVITARADTGPSDATAREILKRVLAQRPTKDLTLRARLWAGREAPAVMEILVKNSPDETRTIYRTGETAALIIQPADAEPRVYLRGQGELTGAARLQALGGSRFTLYDLGLPFLRWPNVKLLGEERLRGRPCHLLEVEAADQPYARVRLWIDKDASALLKAEALNADGDAIRRFSVSSFRHVGDVWVPRGMEMAFIPPGQALPAEERSRLEVYDGNYDATLPLEEFAPEKFK